MLVIAIRLDQLVKSLSTMVADELLHPRLVSSDAVELWVHKVQTSEARRPRRPPATPGPPQGIRTQPRQDPLPAPKMSFGTSSVLARFDVCLFRSPCHPIRPASV